MYWNALTVINKIAFTSPEARVEFSGEKIKPRRWSKPFEHILIYIRLKGQLKDLFSLEQGKQVSNCKSRNHAMQRMSNKISYNAGTEPTLNHAISIVSNLNCFRVMFFRKTLLLNISWCFCERLRVKRAPFLRLLNVLFYHERQSLTSL